MSHTSARATASASPATRRTRRCRPSSQILDGVPPSNLRTVRLERPPMTAVQVLGRRRDDPAARADRRRRQAVRRRSRGTGCSNPIGMTNSTYRAAAAGDAPRAGRARARSDGQRDGRPVARLSRTGGRRPVDHADRSREVRDRSAAVAAGPIESRADAAGDGQEMVTPVGVGPFAVGFHDREAGRRLVLRARRQQLGIPVRPDRAPRQGLRRRDHDQRRQRLSAHPGAAQPGSSERISGTCSTNRSPAPTARATLRSDGGRRCWRGGREPANRSAIRW